MARNSNTRPNKQTLGITYRGVSVVNRNTNNGMITVYRARITAGQNGVEKSLGYFSTPEEAALAYNKAAKRTFRTERNARKKGYWNEVTA